MKPQRLTERFLNIFRMAVDLADAAEADALVLVLEATVDWEKLKELAGDNPLIIAADEADQIEGTVEAELPAVLLEMPGAPMYEKLTQALLECVAEDHLEAEAEVVAVYSGFEAGSLDSISLIRMTDHLGRLTARDLRQLATKVPLDTLKLVVDLAVEIGREGREGKPVGTLFLVGDVRNVLEHSHPVGFDPVRGYNRKERNLREARVREGIKEIAQMDGAILVASDGTVEAACRFLEAPASDITLPKGLGTRHWSAAAVTQATKALAVVVSETNGTVRIFQNGEVVLRVEPFRRAMKWRDFEFEPPVQE